LELRAEGESEFETIKTVEVVVDIGPIS